MMKLLLLLLGALACVGRCASAQISDPVPREATVGELYDLLGIKVHAGSFEFRKPYKEVGMVFEGSVNGKVIFTASAGSMSSDPGPMRPGVCKYSVTVVDLDTLPLGKGHPGYCRVYVRFLCENEGGTGDFTDIAKADFDLSGAFNASAREVLRGPGDIQLDADGRTLVFQLDGADTIASKIGPDGKTTFDLTPSSVKLRCYFVGK